MSLFLNLINYSSTIQSQYSLSLPNIDEKDIRSRSLCISTKEQEKKPSKTIYKSLSKMLNQQPQQAIDPKTRILHRIGHSLSIKYKKNFYAFFVNLQTLKKKNLYLTPQGEFKKIETKKPTFNQKDVKIEEQKFTSEKNIINYEQKKKIFNKFVQKIEELDRLLLIKQFEQYTKAHFFHSIKNNYFCKDKVHTIVQNLKKCIAKLSCYRVLKTLKKINQQAFKIEILSTLVVTINKKYNKINPSDEFQIKENVFSVLKKNFFNSNDTITSKGCSNKVLISESHSAQKITNQKQIFVKQNLDSNRKESSSSNKKSFKGSQQTINIQDYVLQIKHPLESLEAKVLNVEQRKFDRTETNMLKSLSLKICLKEEPIILCESIKVDNSSNFCNKIVKNYLSPSVNDKDEQFNTIFTSNSKANNFLSRFQLSDFNPYISNKSTKSNKKKLNLNLNSSDEKGDEFQISQISGITLLNTDKSASTLFNEKSFNFSNAIGTQCVNFKNSLVQERESLKDTDKNFTKKRPFYINKSQVQGKVFTKSFLRSTFDNKGKANFKQSAHMERAYSSNKESELLIRIDRTFTQVKPQNRVQQKSWAVISSDRQQDESMIETRMESQFRKVNMSMLSNQNYYPTRDVSGVVPIVQSIKSTPYLQKQGNQREEKQKSFIKLFSKKKEISMISKNSKN